MKTYKLVDIVELEPLVSKRAWKHLDIFFCESLSDIVTLEQFIATIEYEVFQIEGKAKRNKLEREFDSLVEKLKTEQVGYIALWLESLTSY